MCPASLGHVYQRPSRRMTLDAPNPVPTLTASIVRCSGRTGARRADGVVRSSDVR